MSSSYEYVLLVFVKENIKIFWLIALCLAVYRARPRLLSPNALRSLMVLIGGMREMSCFMTRFPAVTKMTRLLPLAGHECGWVEAQNVGSYKTVNPNALSWIPFYPDVSTCLSFMIPCAH
jgi:hypothetical protein